MNTNDSLANLLSLVLKFHESPTKAHADAIKARVDQLFDSRPKIKWESFNPIPLGISSYWSGRLRGSLVAQIVCNSGAEFLPWELTFRSSVRGFATLEEAQLYAEEAVCTRS